MELLTSITNHNNHPELLRQVILELVNDIPGRAFIIYTDDGNRLDMGITGSGIFSNISEVDIRFSIRNAGHCSVFSPKLIAISGVLYLALNSDRDSILTPDRQQALHSILTGQSISSTVATLG